MNYEEFVKRMQAEVKEKAGDTAEVECRRVTKNNGVEMGGLVISEIGRNISPMIYLEEYYNLYKKGVPLSEIADDILRVYDDTKTSLSLHPDFYRDFDRVAPRLVCKLINYEKNKEQLSRTPHIQCLDLALVFYYAMEKNDIGGGTILIHNSHLDMWGITRDRLCEIARRNTPRLMPYELKTMKAILEESFEGTEEFTDEGLPMYVLSNTERQFGAVNMIYDSVLAKVGGEIGGDFYILPSSVHECIIVPADSRATKSELENMVWDINRTQVMPEEVLSDSVYYYDRDSHRLSL